LDFFYKKKFDKLIFVRLKFFLVKRFFYGQKIQFINTARSPNFNKARSLVSNVSFSKEMKKDGPKIIKKYGNRKLYDTEQSSYVVLKDIEKMIKNKEEIKIIDNETKDDITVQTLTQIIFSSEKKSNNYVPLDVLTSIIREGDGSLSTFLSKLGLFTNDPSEKKTSPSTEDRIEKNSFIKPYSSIEQKITNLMSSNEGLSSGGSKESSIPNLPGNKL